MQTVLTAQPPRWQGLLRNVLTDALHDHQDAEKAERARSKAQSNALMKFAQACLYANPKAGLYNVQEASKMLDAGLVNADAAPTKVYNARDYGDDLEQDAYMSGPSGGAAALAAKPGQTAWQQARHPHKVGVHPAHHAPAIVHHTTEPNTRL